MINITEKFGKGGNLMTKKKFTEEELRFNEDIKKIVLDIYLPKDKEVPRDKENRQFTLLAQINIEELPENNIYPMKEGILQFWILNDDVYGLDFDNLLGNGYKVVYYKEIDKSVTEEEILEKYNLLFYVLPQIIFPLFLYLLLVYPIYPNNLNILHLYILLISLDIFLYFQDKTFSFLHLLSL